MRSGISRFDDFWAVHVNGYIFLLEKEDFANATKTAAQNHSDEEWSQFLLAISAFSRMSNAKKHSRFEKEAVQAVQGYFQKDPTRIPNYRFIGNEAKSAAKTFIEACTMAPASKGLFTLEELNVDGSEQWVLREFYPQSVGERLSDKKRLAKTVTINPDSVKEIQGNSTSFKMYASGEWLKIQPEGIRAP